MHDALPKKIIYIYIYYCVLISGSPLLVGVVVLVSSLQCTSIPRRLQTALKQSVGKWPTVRKYVG